LVPDSHNTFIFIDDDRVDLIPRAVLYFAGTFIPKTLSEKPANIYLSPMADRDGHLFEAGKPYKVDVPADMPVRQFWSLTVYDRATWAFIYTDSGRTTLSTYDVPNMKKNADGGVTLYVGPKAPEGLEANWIPTRDKRPFPNFRFYGATDALHNKTFKMPDFEEVK